MYTLLIVDDEPLIRKGIKELIDFQALSIEKVFEVSNGEEALGVFYESKPDIILADINMPKMDGLEFANRVKKENKYVKIAIITGYQYFEYAQSALKVGVDDFVLKPVSKNDIQQLLKRMVEEIKEEEANKNLRKSLENLYDMNYSESKDIGYGKIILEALKNNMSDSSFSLNKLASVINLSPGHLSAVFKKTFGIPFHEYLVKMRLERAKIMLLATDYKVYEIAEKTGFDDPNYFSTSFKRNYGTSPNTFRNSKSGGYP